ncbi:hypothetical protein NKJ93_23800 [Mesorhizobium sp. M0028]|uniref:hypothetical protein n=1 Tax=Mesorhizobium sp. M0028 TaxID=2956849 RepID=UPI0033398AAE
MESTFKLKKVSVKTSLQCDSGHVTQPTLRLLLRRSFSEFFDRIPSLLSGQIGITKSALNSVVITRDYGEDVALPLDFYKKDAGIASLAEASASRPPLLHSMALQVSRELLVRIDDATFNSGKAAVSDELSLVRG